MPESYCEFVKYCHLTFFLLSELCDTSGDTAQCTIVPNFPGQHWHSFNYTSNECYISYFWFLNMKPLFWLSGKCFRKLFCFQNKVVWIYEGNAKWDNVSLWWVTMVMNLKKMITQKQHPLPQLPRVL